ncbi:formate dehydrogenase subunit delta [Maritimibacter fusiformis]|uniref:Formate dehydrogenase subunit delta n=1 Tax=Maritimibacter fusiformis TaxID=2603819 RepID=A0A5D0REM6_9RHOB|nr:formate dehydrogenase subunit delta [Maritimibacter fusiformis]TYB79962.1 formate dehydrogenase subunit delta [Maritimibacter fusiformis]
MSPDKMIHMANQIAAFFNTQPGGDGAEKVAAHLSDFWEERMRRQLFAHVDAGGDRLDPLVLAAVAHLRQPAGQTPDA